MLSIEINGNTLSEDAHGSLAARVATTAASANRSNPYATTVPDVAHSDYILLEAKNAALTADQKEMLKESNVELLEYKGNNVYLCGYTPKTLDAVTSLDFIRHAEVYDPYYVIQRDLKVEGDVNEVADVLLTLHDDIQGDAPLEKAVKEISDAIDVPESEVNVSYGAARVSVPKTKLSKLAEVDAVKAITKHSTPRLHNSVAGRIMEVHKPIGLTNRVYKGAKQTVCVADTGFDKGLTKGDVHPAFGDRVKEIQAFGTRSDDSSIQAFGGDRAKHDFAGHGTHVAGSVLGKGACDPKLQKFKDGQDVEGPASEAELIFQTLSTGWIKESKTDQNGNAVDMKWWEADLGGIPKTFQALGDPAYEKGARIHTNSWGTSGTLPNGTDEQDKSTYTQGVGNMDDYLAYTKPNLVVLFSASNDGVDVDKNPGHVDPSSLSYEACAKNVITVGASESERTGVTYSNGGSTYGPRVWGDWRGDFPNAPITADDVANNKEGLAGWSSRGPAWISTKRQRGRIKPDVVAPGTTILSSRSRAMDPKHYADGWGRCDDPAWMFSGGTSMATPLVAGCCAVIRGALVDSTTQKPTSAVIANPIEPSAALIKAILINGAVALRGQYNQKGSLPNGEFGPDYDRPNIHYGFGRVNLNNSLQHIVPETPGVTASFGDITGSSAIGDDKGFKPSHSFRVDVPKSNTAQTLKVTLVYHDKGSAELTNNLNLVVQGAGIEKHGNMPGGSKEFDDVNNVEQVKWKNIQPGTYNVTIIAARTIKPQSFAYAWRLYQDV
ncbi:subtilisin-like protease [Podospora didyma]|uniref:Subtilisin-like protease n=1 Tax=Podospora didyma TaxID=330526 RepID=A0AAE0U5F3_9PEZI|nr:subtilisin-like protease [Podospora didyma]